MDHQSPQVSISLGGGSHSDPEQNQEQAPTTNRKKPRAKRYQCHLCSRRCVRPSELQEHLAMHAGHKPYGCVCGYATPYKSNLSRHQSRCESIHPQSLQTSEPNPTSPPLSEQDQMSPVSEKASAIEDDDFEVGGPYVEEESPLASSSHGAPPVDSRLVHPETRRPVNIAEPHRRFRPHPLELIHGTSQNTLDPTSSYRTPWPVSVPVHHPGWPNPVSQVPAINPDTIGHNYPTENQYTSHQSTSESGRHVSQFEQNIQSGQANSSMSQRQFHHPQEPGPLRAYRLAAFGSDNSSHPHPDLGYSQPLREPIHHQTLSRADPPSNLPPGPPHHSAGHHSQFASREVSHLPFATASQQSASYYDSGPTLPQVAFQQSQQVAFQSSHERHLHPNEHASLEPLQYPPWDSMPDSYDQLHSSPSGSTHHTFSPPPKPPGWR